MYRKGITSFINVAKRPFPSQKIAKDWVGFDPESSPSKVVIRSTIPQPIDGYSFLLYLLGWETSFLAYQILSILLWLKQLNELRRITPTTFKYDYSKINYSFVVHRVYSLNFIKNWNKSLVNLKTWNYKEYMILANNTGINKLEYLYNKNNYFIIL